MIATFTAMSTSLRLGLRYQSNLDISIRQSLRYWLKCLNLAMCYRGFVVNHSLRAAREAGKAAFLCCAYDVATDWHKFDFKAFQELQSILKAEAPATLAKVALQLYRQESTNTLENDGLSRGVDALFFVTSLIGSEKYLRQNLNFNHAGTVLQIVDDVLDLEEDIPRNECNCLLSAKRESYLLLLINFDAESFRALLPHGLVLHKVIKKAKIKAKKLLFRESASLIKLQEINHYPAK